MLPVWGILWRRRLDFLSFFEEQFEDSSYGYRLQRSQHQCLAKLGETIQQNV